MNRHDRRAAAARTRGRKPGYMHRILADGGLDHLVAGKRGVFVANIEHDGTCSIYRGQGCDCVPDISINIDGTVHVIDELGRVASRAKVSFCSPHRMLKDDVAERAEQPALGLATRVSQGRRRPRRANGQRRYQ
jgi:hypothetical protein